MLRRCSVALLVATTSTTHGSVPSLQLNTGAHMPAIAFGTYQIDGDEMRQALRHAIAAGFRHIDTAAGYGNEHIVAEAVAESGIPREDFFLTTKLWCTDHGGQETFDAVLQSLGELGTEYIDLYLMHAPNNLGETDAEKVEMRKQSWEVMCELHEPGLLRAIGVSNFEPRHIEQLLEWGGVTPATNQVELHSHLAQCEIRDFCEDKGILVQSYGSVGAVGLLEDPTVQRISAARGKSAAQITLRHSLQRGCGVLARSLTQERIKENLCVFDFELTAEEVSELDALDRGPEEGRSYWDNSGVP